MRRADDSGHQATPTSNSRVRSGSAMSRPSEITPVWRAPVPDQPDMYALWTLVTFDPAEEPVLYVAPLGAPHPVVGEPVPPSWTRASLALWKLLPPAPDVRVRVEERAMTTEDEERLLAAIMRRVLTVDRTWAGLEGNDLCIDGWVRLDPDEEALVRRITDEWEPVP